MRELENQIKTYQLIKHQRMRKKEGLQVSLNFHSWKPGLMLGSEGEASGQEMKGSPLGRASIRCL